MAKRNKAEAKEALKKSILVWVYKLEVSETTSGFNYYEYWCPLCLYGNKMKREHGGVSRCDRCVLHYYESCAFCCEGSAFSKTGINQIKGNINMLNLLISIYISEYGKIDFELDELL